MVSILKFATTVLDGVARIRLWFSWVLMVASFVPLLWFYVTTGPSGLFTILLGACYVVGLAGFLAGLFE